MTNSNRKTCWAVLSATVLTLIIGSWVVHRKQAPFLLLQQQEQEQQCPDQVTSTSSTIETTMAPTTSADTMTSRDIFNGSGASAPDGHKAVCLDLDVGPVYGNCLVYSFGINNQWAFDDAMSQFGCHVYSFDPSMGVASHNRSDKIHFYNIGLDGEDRIHPKTNWKMKTATSIYEMLSPLHGEKLIDVFKMDIEFSEWDAIPQMIRSGFLTETVKQMAVEIHFSPDDSLDTFRHRTSILQNLESSLSLSGETAGFVRFSSRLNPWLKRPIQILDSKKNYIGFELAWYNSRFYKHNGDEIYPD